MALLPLSCGLFGGKGNDADASTGSSASARASASAAPRVGLTSFERVSLPFGFAPPPGDAWTLGFGVERRAGDEGLDLAGAVKFCQARKEMVCTETQWQRACASNPKLGAMESWTLSAVGQRAVVRGGKGCLARKTAPPTQQVPTRVAVCCDRAVAISSEDKGLELLEGSAKRLLAWERAAARPGPGLAKLLDESVVFHGRRRDAAGVTEALPRPDGSTLDLIDKCDVTTEKAGDETRFVSDCTQTHLSGDQISAKLLRIVHGGPDKKILLVGSRADMALLNVKEEKERVRKFLGGD